MKLSGSLSGRSKTLAMGVIVVMVIFVIQLFYLQVIRHDYYTQQAENEHVAKLTIPATRGKIYATDAGKPVPMVLNEPVYTAYADPVEVDDKQAIKTTMRRIAGGNTVKGYERGLDDTKLRYVVLAKELSRKQAELLKKQQLAGVGLQESSRRVYPEKSLAAQLLGYVNTDGIGQYGVESALDDRLKGEAGLLQAVTDVRRIPLSIGKDDIRRPAKDGDDLVLSIDRGIQSYAEQALRQGLKRAEATTGSVVVMDPNTGKVLAMANYPTYDPSAYNKVRDYGVFQNKVVSEPYEAGSVIKTLTMGAGLDSGAVRRDSTFNNTGRVKVDDTTITNVEESPMNPNTTMTDVLHYSLNTGVVHVLQQMGGGQVNKTARDTLHSYFTKRYFFGKPTGIEQANELKGTLYAPNQEQGNNVRYSNMAFGQGMDVTMIQVASAFSAAINGGTYYKPTILAGTLKKDLIQRSEPVAVRRDVLKPQVSATLREMIYDARRLGMFGSQDRPGYMVGGKTGTSQIIDPQTGKYTDDNSIGTYLGFGGNERPRYVIMVQVKDAKIPGYAGTVAAGPIFTDISNWLLDYLKVEPRS